MAGFDRLVSPSESGRAAPFSPGAQGMVPSGARHGKLGYLLHMLANLSQPLLIVGPEGSGKTRLLRQVQSSALENWAVCYVAATPNLSYERVLEEMRELLRRPGQDARQVNAEEFLAEQLELFAKQGRSFVLLLDQAGSLMPGLLGALSQLPDRWPRISLAFSLRPEELAEKAASDGFALAQAHRIDLYAPPEPDGALETGSHPAPVAKPGTSSKFPGEISRQLLALWSKLRLQAERKMSSGARPVVLLSVGAVAAALAAGLVVRGLWPQSSSTPAPIVLPAVAERLHESPKITPAPTAVPLPAAETPSPASLAIPSPVTAAPVRLEVPSAPPAPQEAVPPAPAPTAAPARQTVQPTPVPAATKPASKPRKEKPKAKKPPRKKQRQLVIDLDDADIPAATATPATH